MLALRAFCLTIMTLSFIFAQEAPTVPTKVPDRDANVDAEPHGTSPSLQLTFEKQTHDFGVIEQADTLTTTFRFAHSGYEPIEIVKVEADCGCTVPKMDKRIYDPGEVGILKVEFDPSQFVGDVAKKIIVRFAHGSEKETETQLTLQANVIAEISYAPRRISLKDIEPSAPTDTKVSIKGEQLEKLEITNLKTYPEWLAASLQTTSDTESEVQLTLSPDLFPKGQTHLRGYLTFTTNAQNQRHIRIPVEASLRQNFSVTPDSAMFWNVTPAEASPVTLEIDSIEDVAIEVTESSASLPYLKVSIEQNKVTVGLKDDAPAGRFAGTIALTVKAGEEQHALTIPVRGKIKDN